MKKGSALGYKNILCIRLDNMGDVLMSSPAIRALKESLSARITLLTSSKGKEIAHLLPYIDDVMVSDVPWVKLEGNNNPENFSKLVHEIEARGFDACVIFTVYSQNPMPAILLAYLAGIPARLAYCRENPYHLLTHWVPDKEPFTIIKHQVERDLDLVKHFGAETYDPSYQISISKHAEHQAFKKLERLEIDPEQPFFVFHCGVSEAKRKYPEALWINAAKRSLEAHKVPILFTGSYDEGLYIRSIQEKVGGGSRLGAGIFSLDEFIAVLARCALIVSVNTSAIHLASAVKTPTVVLYAQTNPQHTPWGVRHKVLDYSIPEDAKSKNEIISYVDKQYYASFKPVPSPEAICYSMQEILQTL